MTRRGPGKWQQKRRPRHDIEQGHFNGHGRIRTKHGKEDHNAGDGQAESRYHDGQGQEQAGSPFLFSMNMMSSPLLFVERVQILSQKGCPMKPKWPHAAILYRKPSYRRWIISSAMASISGRRCSSWARTSWLSAAEMPSSCKAVSRTRAAYFWLSMGWLKSNWTM